MASVRPTSIDGIEQWLLNDDDGQQWFIRQEDGHWYKFNRPNGGWTSCRHITPTELRRLGVLGADWQPNEIPAEVSAAARTLRAAAEVRKPKPAPPASLFD